jgi:hypothetical protein
MDKSEVIAIRLPKAVCDKIRGFNDGRRGYHESIGSYCKDLIIYQVMRKHGGKKKSISPHTPLLKE